MNMQFSEMVSYLAWGKDNALLLFFLSLLIWLLGVRLKKLSIPLIQPLIFLLLFLSLGYMLVGDAFVWVLFCVLIGTGIALHTLVFDVIAGFLLRLEQRVIRNSWIDGSDFSGRVQERYWRCVVLLDMWGRTIIIPNRIFLQKTIQISPPGSYRTSIELWIPENRKLLEIEDKLMNWLDNSPWISQTYGLYPDSRNPRLFVVDLSLLYAEDKHKVMRAMRTIIEKE